VGATGDTSTSFLVDRCRNLGGSKGKWAHINFETAEWTIPEENSKNGVEHIVNLSEFALR
jgi:hypothetical protein